MRRELDMRIDVYQVLQHQPTGDEARTRGRHCAVAIRYDAHCACCLGPIDAHPSKTHATLHEPPPTNTTAAAVTSPRRSATTPRHRGARMRRDRSAVSSTNGFPFPPLASARSRRNKCAADHAPRFLATSTSNVQDSARRWDTFKTRLVTHTKRSHTGREGSSSSEEERKKGHVLIGPPSRSNHPLLACTHALPLI